MTRRRSASGSACRERYLVYPGRYDARQDLATSCWRARPAGRSGPAGRPGRRGTVAAAHPARRGDARRPRGARPGGDARARRRRARLCAGPSPDAGSRRSSRARGPRSCRSLSEAAGFAAIDALASGTPVVASAVGALPEHRRDGRDPRRAARPGRLAAALQTAWTDEPFARADRRGGAGAARRVDRTWADVADATCGGSTRRSASAADPGSYRPVVASDGARS